MLNNPTTFVLGAGASCDFKFPTGEKLQGDIAKSLSLTPDFREFTSDRIREAVHRECTQGNWGEQKVAFLTAAIKIANGMPSAASIDNYLHTHQNDQYVVRLGKIAIAEAILVAERKSPLFTKPSQVGGPSPLTRPEYAESWYSPFMRMLTQGTLQSEPRKLFQNARFVVFNYDRCLEQIILLTLQSYYGINEMQAVEILDEVEIVHPYGSIGSMGQREARSVPYGWDQADIGQIAGSIKTFTESADAHVVERARECIAQAKTLVFLGFGFLPQNMDLLAPTGKCDAARIHATTHDISASDKVVVKEQLKRFAATPDQVEMGEVRFTGYHGQRTGFIDVENGTCLELFKNHRLRLSA